MFQIPCKKEKKKIATIMLGLFFTGLEGPGTFNLTLYTLNMKDFLILHSYELMALFGAHLANTGFQAPP